jgi:hypothetical protein
VDRSRGAPRPRGGAAAPRRAPCRIRCPRS